MRREWKQKILQRFSCCLLFSVCVLLLGCAKTDGTGDKTQDASKPRQEDVEVNERCIDEIKERGYLIAGCKMDVPDLGLYDKKTDSWSGLEVELAYQSAANIFEVSLEEAKEQNLVKFVGVTVADREEKLEQKEVDCLFATYTADVDGKYIGVPKNATTRKTFLNYIETMNNLRTSPIFMEYESYEALFRALKHGDIDVMAVDVSILNGYVDKSTKILNDRFGGQHYGAAVRKENARILDFVNEALKVTD